MIFIKINGQGFPSYIVPEDNFLSEINLFTGSGILEMIIKLVYRLHIGNLRKYQWRALQIPR